jgi:hypothetical protein
MTITDAAPVASQMLADHLEAERDRFGRSAPHFDRLAERAAKHDPAWFDGMTDGGVVPFPLALFALPPQLRLLVAGCLEHGRSRGAHTVRLCRAGHGHRLLRVDERVPDGGSGLVSFTLGKWEAKALGEAMATLSDLSDKAKAAARRRIAAKAADGTLSLTVDTVRETLLHMPPVMLLLDGRLYSSLRHSGANMVDGKDRVSRLSTLMSLPLEDWSEEDQYLVDAADLLLRSGGYYRLEEVNGTEVDPLSVCLFLEAKRRAYGGGERQPDHYDSETLVEQVKILEHGLSKGRILYRVICGPRLNKAVDSLRRDASYPTPTRRLSEALLERFPDVPVPGDDQAWLTDLSLRASASGMVEDLIVTVVRSGLADTNSDFFMSRGPVELYLGAGYEQRSSKDFFCLVESREGLDTRSFGLTHATEEVRRNQSLRMQFNSWKFWHGSLPAEERGETRHWFFPSRFPDIAFAENRVHPGHRDNGVVHSIRASGPLWLTHLDGRGRRELASCFDCRGARCDIERPYGLEDLRRCIDYRVWLGTIYQTLADHGIETGRPATIRRFGHSRHFKGSGP